MKRNGRVLSALMAVAMTVTLFSGCGKTTTESSTSTVAAQTTTQAKESLSEAPIIINVAGDEQKLQADVLAEIEKQTKDELNVKLTVNYTPWSDYMTKTNLKLASGEQFDIFLNFNGDMTKMAAKGYLAPLNDLLDKYGSDLKNVIPKGEFDGVSIDGKIYGIPSIYPRVATDIYFIRKDLREKYGLPEINNLQDFEGYLDAVKKNDPTLIPLAISGNPGTASLRAIDPNYQYKWAYKGVINVASKPYKVENQMRSSLIVSWANWARKAYKNGWTNKDAATQKDPGGLVRSGKAAATSWDMFGMQSVQPELAKNVPGAVLETVNFEKDKPYVATEGSNNMACINAASENKERAVMFLNWIRKDQKNYDLYMYGIEGKTYNKQGDKIETLPKGEAPMYNPTPWFTKQLSLDRLTTTDSAEFTKAFEFYKNMKFTNSEIQGFTPNLDSVKKEVGTVDTMANEKWTLIQCGMVDYNEQVVKEIEDAGLNKILAEIQKQLDDYCAKNGIK